MIYIDSKHDDSLTMGKLYESQIVDFMKNLYGIVLHIYEDKNRQYYIGENGEGYEIKLDAHIEHSHRMSIEIGEKINLKQPKFTPSGIYRKDNTNFYIQGFYNFAWLFWKSDLRQYHYQFDPRIIDSDPPTIQKFYIPATTANDLSVHRFALNDSGLRWYYICGHDTPPVPKWKNCLECPEYSGEHCNSKGGKELQLYLRRNNGNGNGGK